MALGAGSYWHYPFAHLVVPNGLNHVQAVLTSESCSVELLLDAEDLFQELKNRNGLLLSFLKSKKSLLELVRLCTELPEADSSDARKYKYPLYACEALCANNGDLSVCLCETNGEDAVNLLWDFLRPHNPEESLFINSQHLLQYLPEEPQRKPHTSASLPELRTPDSKRTFSSASDFWENQTSSYSAPPHNFPQNENHHFIAETNGEANRNPVLMGYFCRIVATMHQQSPDAVICYLQRNPWRLRHLLHHIGARSVTDLIIQLINCGFFNQVGETGGGHVVFNPFNVLPVILTALVTEDPNGEKHESISTIIRCVLRKLLNLNDLICGLFPYWFSSIHLLTENRGVLLPLYLLSLLTPECIGFLKTSCVMAAIDILTAICVRVTGIPWHDPAIATGPTSSSVSPPDLDLQFTMKSNLDIANNTFIDRPFADVVIERNFDSSEAPPALSDVVVPLQIPPSQKKLTDDDQSAGVPSSDLQKSLVPEYNISPRKSKYDKILAGGQAVSTHREIQHALNLLRKRIIPRINSTTCHDQPTLLHSRSFMDLTENSVEIKPKLMFDNFQLSCLPTAEFLEFMLHEFYKILAKNLSEFKQRIISTQKTKQTVKGHNVEHDVCTTRFTSDYFKDFQNFSPLSCSSCLSSPPSTQTDKDIIQDMFFQRSMSLEQHAAEDCTSYLSASSSSDSPKDFMQNSWSGEDIGWTEPERFSPEFNHPLTPKFHCLLDELNLPDYTIPQKLIFKHCEGLWESTSIKQNHGDQILSTLELLEALKLTSIFIQTSVEIIQSLLTSDFLNALVQLLISESFNTILHISITNIFQTIILLEVGCSHADSRTKNVAYEVLICLLNETNIIPAILRSCKHMHDTNIDKIGPREEQRQRQASFGSGQTLHLIHLGALLCQKRPQYPIDIQQILVSYIQWKFLVETQAKALKSLLKMPLCGGVWFTHFANPNSQISVLPLGLGGSAPFPAALPAPPPMIGLAGSAECPSESISKNESKFSAEKKHRTKRKRTQRAKKNQESTATTIKSATSEKIECDETGDIIEFNEGFSVESALNMHVATGDDSSGDSLWAFESKHEVSENAPLEEEFENSIDLSARLENKQTLVAESQLSISSVDVSVAERKNFLVGDINGATAAKN